MDLDAPVVGSRTIALDVDLVLAGQGLRRGARPVGRVLEAARRAVELGRDLLLPRFITVTVPIAGRAPARVDVAQASLEGEAIARALEGAQRVVAVVCTIGDLVERRVSALLAVDPL